MATSFSFTSRADDRLPLREKLGTALGGAILGWRLSNFSFESQSESQSASAIYGIAALFTLAPAIGHLLLTASSKLSASLSSTSPNS